MLSDIGPVLARRLLTALGSPENIFHASLKELKTVEDIGDERAKKIIEFDQWEVVQREIDGIMKNNAKLITINDSSYPEGLRYLYDAPLILYVKGDFKETDRYAIAIVGSRTPTHYGIHMAEEMSYALASYGLTIVSGMARGIDSASHRGALKAKGRTIAVLGSGIDIPYPPENRELMNMIASSGAVISEFPLGIQPEKGNFPRRNRIISALSAGVIVIEATQDSGSLITVGYALEQGKEVFAVPGNVTSKNSKGTNDLIKKGAKLVENAEDVIEELKPQINDVFKEGDISEKTLPLLNEEEKRLYSCLNTEPKHIDIIIRESGVPINRALSILLNLELKGIVNQTEGKRFYLS
jgi:DNA processing protein